MIPYRKPGTEVEREALWIPHERFYKFSIGGEHFVEYLVSLALRDVSKPFCIWALAAKGERPRIHLNGAALDSPIRNDGPDDLVWHGTQPVPADTSAAFINRIKIGGLSSDDSCRAVLLTNDPFYLPPPDADRFETDCFGVRRAELGRSKLEPDAITVRSAHVFKVIYTAGKAGIAKGGGVAVGVPWGLFSPPAGAPDAEEGVPVAAACSNAAVKLKVVPDDRRDVCHATRERILRVEVAHGALAEGDVVEIAYGSEADKVRCDQVYAYLYYKTEKERWYTDTVPFRVMVDHSGSGEYVPLPMENSHRLEVHAGPPRRLYITVPSIIVKGRPASLSLAVTDDFNGRPEPAVEGNLGGVDIRNSAGRARTAALDQAGRVQVKAKLGPTELAGTSNPVAAFAAEPRHGLFWGDIHGHCDMDDAVGGVEDYFAHAREMAHLDFTALSCHTPYLADCQWEYIQDVGEKWNTPGEFAVLHGYEWSGQGGHRNIYTPLRGLPIFRPNDGVTAVENLWEALSGQDRVLVVPHHTLPGGKLEPHAPDFERLIEVYSMWGCSECRGHRLCDKPENPTAADELLRQGMRLGFISGSDNHDGRPGRSGIAPGVKSRYPSLTFKAGLVAVYAEELTADSIFDALASRRCYGTTGERIILDFRLNGHLMGEELPASDSRKIEARVIAADEVELIEIIRNGRVIKTEKPEADAADVSWTDLEKFERIAITDARMGGKVLAPFAFYYIRITQRNGEMAWSSPVWLSAAE